MRTAESRRAFCLGYFLVLTNFDVQIRLALNNAFHIKPNRAFWTIEFPDYESVAGSRENPLVDIMRIRFLLDHGILFKALIARAENMSAAGAFVYICASTVPIDLHVFENLPAHIVSAISVPLKPLPGSVVLCEFLPASWW